ncbi:MAG: cobyrinate a,c-diamide synthase [Thermoleophilia bacterium]
MKLPRIVVSAPHRSSGKTTVSIGLCAALSDAGMAVQPFKKGPDFIDPMWLAAAAGRECRNLDLFMMGDDEIARSVSRNGAGAGIAIIEGNMGLFDSIDVEGRGSTSDLARQLGAPVILVVNTRNMTRSIAPLVQGFTQFEPDINIAGIILNMVSGPRHEDKLRAVLERYCDIEVVGAIRRRPEIGIIERHLGLQPAREALGSAEVVAQIEKIISESVDLDRVRAIAAAAPDLPDIDTGTASHPAPTVRLGIAQDRAFTFYYPENLEALRAAGAELVPFSPLADEHLPEVDGLYIGGGFPEVFMEELEANRAIRSEIREAIEAGMPVYAECGGLMYLSGTMSWQGKSREMVGALPCDILMHEKPRGHGYMELEAVGANAWFEPGLTIRGHEFHYSEVVGLDPDKTSFAYKVRRGTGVDKEHDGILYKNVLASYTHLHSLGSPGWAEGLVAFVRGKAGAI